MPSLKLKETTTVQKLLIILFIVTITLSCISLVWMQVEKPGKVTKRCELINQFAASHNFSEGEFKLNVSKLNPSCPTTTNPPMSPGLDMCINLAMVSGAAFVLLGIYTYLTRKKEGPPVNLKDQK